MRARARSSLPSATNRAPARTRTATRPRSEVEGSEGARVEQFEGERG